MEDNIFDDMIGMPNVNGLEEKGIDLPSLPNNYEEKLDTWSNYQVKSKGSVLMRWEELMEWYIVNKQVLGTHKVVEKGFT